MTVSRTVELEDHLIDSGMMKRVCGLVTDMDGSFHVEQFDVGTRKEDTSYCRMEVSAGSEDDLSSILHQLHQTGANIADPVDATLDPAPGDQVVPRDFYSTTNHPTQIRYDGEWVDVEDVEMDCAIVVEPDGRRGPRAYTKVLNGIEEGDLVVTGEAGIRVRPPERPRDASGPFGFMQGGVSAERPSDSRIEDIADAIVETKADGGEVLAVPGPAVVHSGAREDLARLIREGIVDYLSTGNGFAVHDLERDLYGTSLGMDVENLDHPRRGHKHHIYTISEIIREGGIERQWTAAPSVRASCTSV